ncbi:MAG: DMT family transporter [Erysipelotrichaceae bacterium]|nr:DMT family transporter [Erysipelotrichaceae bacterium]
MISGLLGGLLWGLDTVVLGIALVSSKFTSTETALFLAPFVSTFLHDTFSAIWMFIYMGAKKELPNVLKALKTKSGKFIILGALLGGPIGMTGYVNAIKYIGPSYTAILSALFPAVGALFSYIFLKEKMRWWQIIGLLVAIGGVIGLGYSPSNSEITNLFLGFGFALLCIIGWASEAVICAYGMKDPDVSDKHALQIRQTVSALFYGLIILPLLKGWSFSLSIFTDNSIIYIIASALFGTVSYLCYYKAINKIGASKAMSLNITYSAWSIIFSFILIGTKPTLSSIIFGIIIIIGSLIAAVNIEEFKNKK